MERAKEAAKAYGKHLLKKALKAAAKKTALLAAKAFTAAVGYLVALIGVPAALIGLVILLVAMVIAAFYSAMPGGATLLGVNPDPKDAEVRQYAEGTAAEWNVRETWLVDGEGRWYPGKGKENFGRLVDRFGQDQKLANQWGDIYAPVLYAAAQSSCDDRMRDESWVRDRLRDAAKELRPWFYYKESTVTYCGKDGCESETVYLLVEAYTIRGHYLFKYRWVTKTYPDGGSVTYEEPAGQEKLADGLDNYLRPYLVKTFDIPNDNQAKLVAKAVFEAGAAFSAQAENLAWLMDKTTLWALVSGASIPAEFRGYLEEAEKLTGIPVWFLAAVIEKESSWNPSAVNDKTGCFGLTQLSPDYWPEWARRYGFDPEADKWNPRAQIIVGARVLADYLSRIDWENVDLSDPPENLERALARYGGYGTDVEAARDYIDDILRLAEAYRSRPAVWPVPGYYEITSHFGWRIHPILGYRRFHDGIDIAAPTGADVVSVSGGVVAYAGAMGDYGNAVLVRDAQYEYLYAHLSRIDVSEGETVRPGALLGGVGSTGLSTGPHLHFGIRPVGASEWIDPEPILRKLA
ncbi:MAG: M23 family metallopeptidase [Bacillota bacterium]